MTIILTVLATLAAVAAALVVAGFLIDEPADDEIERHRQRRSFDLFITQLEMRQDADRVRRALRDEFQRLDDH